MHIPPATNTLPGASAKAPELAKLNGVSKADPNISQAWQIATRNCTKRRIKKTPQPFLMADPPFPPAASLSLLVLSLSPFFLPPVCSFFLPPPFLPLPHHFFLFNFLTSVFLLTSFLFCLFYLPLIWFPLLLSPFPSSSFLAESLFSVLSLFFISRICCSSLVHSPSSFSLSLFSLAPFLSSLSPFPYPLLSPPSTIHLSLP